MAYLFRYEPMTTIVFNDPMASLPIRQSYSSQKSALYLSGDGTVHLEVYCTKLLKKMFGKREDLPALRRPVPLPLPTKVVKCSVGPCHLCLVDERGCIFTQGCNRSGQLGTGDRDDRTQLTEMAGSMMPVDVWCGRNYTLVLLKDESGHKELHGCGSGARGRLPGHPKGSNVLVKLNVQVCSCGCYISSASVFLLEVECSPRRVSDICSSAASQRRPRGLHGMGGGAD
ncbi:hypothetical protein CRUP_003967 [Coryphaenoides rupestris]|nr:hypothetical protein CRUP_003967 [Coryphaenoides rupestris]